MRRLSRRHRLRARHVRPRRAVSGRLPSTAGRRRSRVFYGAGPMLIDAHTHLDHCEPDAGQLINEAWQARVGVIIQSGIDLERSRYSVQLARTVPGGVRHGRLSPPRGGAAHQRAHGGHRGLAADPRVVAIGETGLDFYHDNWPHPVQNRRLRAAHPSGAGHLDCPLVVHTREAADLTLSILAEHAAGLTVVLHCFSLPDRLDEVIDRGYYVSFAGNVTYKNAEALQAAAANVPDHLLMFETDAPWLTPVPLRGRPNKPALVAHTYEFVAALRKVDVDRLERQVELNVRRAFPRLAAQTPFAVK